MKYNKPLNLNFGFKTVEKATSEADDSGAQVIKVTGLASTTHSDRQGDIIPSSAWVNGLGNYLKNPIMLFNHKRDRPVGRVTKAEVRDEGLYVEAEISSANSEIFQLVAQGILKAFSVGILVKDALWDSLTELFVITDLELLEISVVSVPANQDALFSVAKAFESTDDFVSFKKSFATNDGDKNLPSSDASKSGENLTMDETKIAELTAAAVAKAMAEADAKRAEEARLAAEATKAQKSVEETARKAAVEVLGTGTEAIVKEVTERLNKDNATLSDAVKGLQDQLSEKSKEIEAMLKTKARFEDKNDEGAVSYADKEKAVFLGYILKKDYRTTKFGKDLVEKAGPHVAGADWEKLVSTNLESEIRRKLVVFPLLRQVSMSSAVMKLPVNPEAGYGSWINSTDYGTTASGGTVGTHQLKEVTLTSYKVATREYLNNEEEEDAILPLMPIIRDAIVRRLAKTIDRAALRGAGSASDPLTGFAVYDTTSAVQVTNTSSVTVATLRALRKDLGTWGLEPGGLRFVVSNDVYYDLLEDSNFMTMDKVGDRATILTGQIGSIGGTPVLLSGEFPAKAGGAATAATNIGAICVAPANFIGGNHRALKFETDNLVETQRAVMVASVRLAMTQLSTVDGLGVSTFRWS